MSTLQEAINKHHAAYVKWVINGMCEADDELNSSNMELVRAYRKEYPNAKGYKAWNGIEEITETIYNFAMDIIFDGTEQAIAEINAESDESKRLNIVEKHNGIYLVWT